MGLFGKSKKEKEEEERIRIHQENLVREEAAKKAATQERLSKLIAAVERVERMSPKWKFDGLDELDLFEKQRDFNGEAEYQSRDRFLVTAVIRHWCAVDNGQSAAILTIRRVNSDSSESPVFFANTSWYPRKKQGNYEEWYYLDNYFCTRIFLPELERRLALKHQQAQSARDDFWNK